MTRKKWLWSTVLALPLAIAGGMVYANSQHTSGYICPVTGEQLPCEKCCPLNGAKSQPKTEGAFVCPVTGEELPCEKCCPLNQQK